MTKQKKVTITMPEALAAKIKGYAAFQNTSMRIFIISTLMERVRLIEKGEDKTIKIITTDK